MHVASRSVVSANVPPIAAVVLHHTGDELYHVLDLNVRYWRSPRSHLLYARSNDLGKFFRPAS